MGRKIGANVRNTLTIQDPVSGTAIKFYYRTPTSEERVGYQNALFKREGEKVDFKITEARQEFGLKILEGFEEGAFENGDGPFSSDPKAPNFNPDWKDLVKTFASDLIETLAAHVFEGARVSSAQTESVTKN